MKYVVRYLNQKSGAWAFQGFDYRNDALEFLKLSQFKGYPPSFYVQEEGVIEKQVQFYVKFDDETLDEAFDSHSVGFETVQAAVTEANALEPSGTYFEVYNSARKLVHKGFVE